MQSHGPRRRSLRKGLAWEDPPSRKQVLPFRAGCMYLLRFTPMLRRLMAFMAYSPRILLFLTQRLLYIGIIMAYSPRMLPFLRLILLISCGFLWRAPRDLTLARRTRVFYSTTELPSNASRSLLQRLPGSSGHTSVTVFHHFQPAHHLEYLLSLEP